MAGGQGGIGDRIREEFLSEAQEIIESLSRELLKLDHNLKQKITDPELLNEIFRGVHTLKGLSSMFGFSQLSTLAHALENLLDDLRLERVELSPDVLDVLFGGVENFQRLLHETGGPSSKTTAEVGELTRSIEAASFAERSSEGSLYNYELDPSILSVLTEYEEHRLRANMDKGVPLYRHTIQLPLSNMDVALENLKTQLRPLGEIITYLPSMNEGDGDSIMLEVLLASSAPLPRLEAVLQSTGGSLTKVAQSGPTEQSRTTADQQNVDAPAQALPPPVPSAPPPVKASKDGDALSLRSVSSTVRVDIRKLDYLMNVVGELAIVQNAVYRATERVRARTELRQLAIELHRIQRSFERHLEELHEGLLDVRMVPLQRVFDKLARGVRNVAREHSKEIQLTISGAQTEVDKLIVEELSDPLMHILRNSIDHGIEPPDTRKASGKPVEGKLSLRAFQKGNHVVIEVEDDGAGIDHHKLIKVALKKKLITDESARELARHEAIKLIFIPGLSTQEDITDLSGRGVGMDVVKTNIAKLGGVIDVLSEPGIGTKFTITLPITLAIVSALVVRISGQAFAIPLSMVQEAIHLNPDHVRIVDGREVITLRGSTLPICKLAEFFDMAPATPFSSHKRPFVVVAALGKKQLGFVVDSLEGQQDIVIKPLGKSLRNVRGFAGATDLGDQQVALVLDTWSLFDEVLPGAERTAVVGAA